jgi:N-acetylglucosamine kinase-like BadF-type ATPase
VSGDLVLGVDGGKSKTVCLLADQSGSVLGAGRAGSSDKYDVPLEQALDAVAGAVQEAARQAGVSLPVGVGCFGLAGADWPDDFAALEEGLRTRGLARQVIVKNDMHIALHANADWGVVVSAGTHTAAAIRTPDGQEWHAGWFAAEGPGGVSAGNRALWAVLKACDGRGAETALTGLVLEATGYASEIDLLRALSAGQISESDQAALAPLIFHAHYRQADPVAAGLIIEIGHEIASWATGLLARFDLLRGEAPVILTGGLFRGEGSLLLDTVTMAVHARAPQARLRLAEREPVIGALVYACEQVQQPLRPGLIDRITQTAPGPEFYRTARLP